MNNIFKKLKGENLIKEHFEIAKKVCDDFKKYKSVKGIVILGGIGRGYSDKYSDIDIIIFTERNLYNKW
ncbi:MAG: nucleotidyltransferase domain-containing protein [Candidatus Omnitrophica bacterium]|nr:nucleotidyltransferase domain-containing protein [Candidatus Omnitrophota bacterium]